MLSFIYVEWAEHACNPMFLISIFLLILQCVMFIPMSYLLLLTIMAWRAHRLILLSDISRLSRFAILIPAHNEENLLPETLESILASNYPRSLYDVYVIADNCNDNTVMRAGEYDVKILIRSSNLDERGKGYALNWGYQVIRQANNNYDAYIFIDADTIVDTFCLSEMAAALSNGAQAAQAYYTVKDPLTSWNTSLRYIALVALHYLRPLGRAHLGGSAGIKGNGMMFTQDILERYSWSGSVTEDIEYHMALILDGIRVQFVPKAVVSGEMPKTFSQSQSQLDRWEQGRVYMMRKYFPVLLRSAKNQFVTRGFKSAFLYLDAAMEHIIPPFTVMVGSVLAGLSGAICIIVWVMVSGKTNLVSIAVVNLFLARA